MEVVVRFRLVHHCRRHYLVEVVVRFLQVVCLLQVVYLLQVVCLLQVVYLLQVVVHLLQVVVYLLQVGYLLLQVVYLLQVVVADLHFQADSQVHKDCLHNLLHFVNQVVYLLQVGYLLLQVVDCILHLLVVVTDLLGLRFVGTQVHKDYHHNLGLE